MPVGEFVDRKLGPITIGKKRGDLLPSGSNREWDVNQDRGSGEECGKYARVVDPNSIEVGYFIDCASTHPKIVRGAEINFDALTRNRFWWKP